MIKTTYKKGFSTQDLIIAGIIFSAVIAFFMIGIGSVQTNYPEGAVIVSDSFNESYNTLSEQLASVDTMRETATSGEGLTFRGAFDVTFGSFFTIMQLVFSTINLFGSMASNIAIDFPFVDSASIDLLLTIGLVVVLIIIIFRLVNAVGRNPA